MLLLSACSLSLHVSLPTLALFPQPTTPLYLYAYTIRSCATFPPLPPLRYSFPSLPFSSFFFFPSSLLPVKDTADDRSHRILGSTATSFGFRPFVRFSWCSFVRESLNGAASTLSAVLAGQDSRDLVWFRARRIRDRPWDGGRHPLQKKKKILG